jgi:hypothetical protein
MKPLPNFDFDSLDTYPKSLKAIEGHLKLLIKMTSDTDFPLSDDHKEQFIKNIQWLKRFYEAAERNLLNGNR